MVITIDGKKQWRLRAVDQHRAVFDVLVSHCDRRLMRKLFKRLWRSPNADHR